MSKKSQKKKRGVSSLIKFLKNRKHAGVALGICLAIAASAYVATAKFSASGPNGADLTGIGKGIFLSVKVVDANGSAVQGVSVTSYDVDSKGKYLDRGTSKSGKEGFTNDNGYELCNDKSGKIYICADNGAAGGVLFYGFAAKVNVAGAKIFAWRKAPIANSLADLNKNYEKRADGDYNTPTIVLHSDGKGYKIDRWKGGTKSTASKTPSTVLSLTPTGNSITDSIRVIDKKTKNGVAGVKITSKTEHKENGKTSWNAETSKLSSGLNGYINELNVDICKEDSRGWYYACIKDNPVEVQIIAYKFMVGENSSSNKNRIVQYNIPQPLAKTEAELNKKFKAYSAKSDLFIPTVYLYSDGSGGYVGQTWDKANKNGTTKTSTAPAGSKVSSAAKTAVSKTKTVASKVKAAVTGTNKTAKVNTTPTKKDKATFSEALPAAKTGVTRNLNFQFKDASTKEPTAGPVKITIVYKVCSNNGCGGDVNGQLPQQSFDVTTKANGMYALSLGVTNIPENKKSILTGKTTSTNRYFFFYGDPTHIVRHLYISNINGENQKEVPIGGFPFATKTEAAAQKFQLKLFTFDKVIGSTESNSEAVDTTTSAPTEEITVPAASSSTSSSSSSSSSLSSSDSKTTGNYQTDSNDSGGWVDVFKSWFGF